MGTLNVKIPDEMEGDIEAFLEANPHYMNKSELVRDALRHVIHSNRADESFRPSGDDPLLSAPTVTVEEPVAEDDVDDVVYGAAEE